MTITQYNISNIITIAILLTGIFWLLYSVIIKTIKKASKNKLSIKIKTIVFACFIVVLTITSVFSYQKNEYSINGIVTDTIRNSSIGDIMVNYTIQIKTTDGEIETFNSPVFSSKELKSKFEAIQCGDTIEIKYDERFNYAYDISEKQ